MNIDYDAPVGPAIPVYLCGRPGCTNALTELDTGLTCETCGARYGRPDSGGSAPYLDDGDDEL